MDIRVWIWPKLKSIKLAIDALRDASMREHLTAHLSGQEERTTADEYEGAQKDMTHELDWRTKPPMVDSSMKGNSGQTQQANPTINISERTLSIISLCLTCAVFGVAVMTVVNQSQSENRTRTELERQNRFLQEYRIRVEDAEIAAEEVNPKFHPRRTE